MTASALKGDREICLAAGCTAYLTKPIKQKVLLQAIRAHTKMPGTPQADPAEGNARADPKTVAPLNAALARYAKTFLHGCRDKIGTIQTALEGRDFGTIEFLGHGMRGAGGTFGFPQITVIGAALEFAAEQSDGMAVGRALRDLSDCLDLQDDTPHPRESEVA